MKLILIRHGQTLWNREKRVQGRSDIALSNRGMAQAALLGEALNREHIEVILSSPLKRAVQTAEAINRFHGKIIDRNRNLMELDQGDFEGRTFQEIAADHPGFLAKWAADPASVSMPRGESLAQLQERSWPVVEEVLAAGRDTLIVAHNFTIMTILCRIQNLDLSQVRKVHVDLASRTCVEFGNGTGAVTLFNDVSHLAGCEAVMD